MHADSEWRGYHSYLIEQGIDESHLIEIALDDRRSRSLLRILSGKSSSSAAIGMCGGMKRGLR